MDSVNYFSMVIMKAEFKRAVCPLPFLYLCIISHFPFWNPTGHCVLAQYLLPPYKNMFTFFLFFDWAPFKAEVCLLYLCTYPALGL